jgi:hypothetical protein
MSSIIAKLFGSSKSDIERSKPHSVAQSKLKLSVAGQVVCQSCAEFDERCIARLILAPIVNPGMMRAGPKSIQLHGTFSELERCGRHGCVICRFLSAILLEEFGADQVQNVLADSSYPVFVSLPDSINRPWVISISTKTSLGDNLDGTVVLENTPSVAEQGRALFEVITSINIYNSRG